MCLRFVFLLITGGAGWLRLSRRAKTWKTAPADLAARLHRPARNHRRRHVMTDRTKPLLTCVMRSCKPIFPRDEGTSGLEPGA